MMESTPNPICKRGERNLFCVHYGDCLDHAVIKRWRRWSCGECALRCIQEERNMVPTVNDSNIYYELPPVLSGEAVRAFG